MALIVVLAVVIIVVLGSGASTPSSAASNSGVAGSTSVQRRNLVETDTEAGTLSYASAQTVFNRLSGTITWLPSVGQVIKPGGALFQVDGRPVILMDGTTPAFRDLKSSDSAGADILQLNRNLVELGFNPDGIVIDDEWQAATTAGVDLFQASLGETETGKLSLGKIVFLPGDQLVSALDGTVGATGGGGGSSGSNASEALSPPRPEFVSYTGTTTSPGTASTGTTSTGTTSTGTTSTGTTSTGTTSTGTASTGTTSASTTTPTTTGPTTGAHKGKHHGPPSTMAALLALLRAETRQLAAELRANHGSSSSHGSTSSNGSSSGNSSSSRGATHAGGSSTGGNPVAILQTTSTKLVVTVDLSASSQSEAVVGEHVTVQMPSGSFVNGRITGVSPIAQSSSNSGNGNGGGGGGGNGNGNGGSSSTVPVTIALNGHQNGAGLDQAAVSVNFVQQRANNVLSVPVTALLATSGSQYAVQEANAPNKLIPVTTGLFAAGYVQISGPGIYPGLQVTDSQG